VGYKAATVPVQALIDAVPELKKVAMVRCEQVFQIASQNMTNDVTKANTSTADTFRSYELGVLGYIRLLSPACPQTYPELRVRHFLRRQVA